ncbi:integral membrane protein DGCR2/IDD-like [Ptychodera flava]|uniref:integral membrane protein DGCR2/IDD-like n=1 Tax=Ptychodera flava TaxID=63121 RepID=UPI003969E436
MESVIWRLTIGIIFALKGSYLVASSVSLHDSRGAGDLTGIDDGTGVPVGDVELPNDVGQLPEIYPGQCPDDWHIYKETKSCYRHFSTKLTYREAQDQCSTLGGFLATVATDSELQFILSKQWEPNMPNNDLAHYSWWMGYYYLKHNDTAQWEVAGEQFLGEDVVREEGVFRHSPLFGRTASDEDVKLCGQLVIDQNHKVGEYTSQWYVEQCSTKSEFLCKRSVSSSHCIDHRGSHVHEGHRFTPNGRDPCVNCTCYQGEAVMCSAALCAGPPNCQNFIQDPYKCCSFTCIDSEYPQEELFDFSDSMRWVLTSATSFLILGLLLFMVHRIRQRRMALIHYTSRSGFRSRSGGMRLNSGSALTPSSPMDEIDAGIYPEPPPPYSLYKPPSPNEEPPPPYDTTLLLDNDSAPSTPVSTTDQNASLLEAAGSSAPRTIMNNALSSADPTAEASAGTASSLSVNRCADSPTEERENVPMLPTESENQNRSTEPVA